jgi:hypothetical protein
MTLVPVHVRLAVDTDTGKISRTGPMLVWCEERGSLEQLTPLEAGGRFLAEWDGDGGASASDSMTD